MTESSTTPSQAFIEGSRRRWNRKWETTAFRDLDDLITTSSYKNLVSNNRKLYANHGIVRGVINQKAMYSVGQAFLPRFLGRDKIWKTEANEYLSRFYKTCNVSGQDLQTTLYILSVAIDRDGDAFVLLTETDDKYPQIQVIPAHQVGQRDDAKTVSEGKYKGFKIKKGIIFQKNGRPVAYRVLGETSNDDKDISATSLIHIFESEYPEQSRGLGLFSHAVNQFRDMADSTERELTAQLLLASIAFVEHNPFGASEDDDITREVGDSIDGKPTCVNYEEGSIKFFKSGDGSKLEAVNNNRPSAEWQAFHDRLERIALVGCNWPKAMVDAPQGNGTADRIALRQAMRSCEDRQALLMPVALRIVVYALAKGIKNGSLNPNDEFYKWSFSTPPSISIDVGRDSNALREEYKLGLKNLTTILEEEGKNLEDHLYERATEEAMATLIRLEIEKEYNTTIDPIKMRMFSQSELNTGETLIK